jgi:DNA repair protein RadC
MNNINHLFDMAEVSIVYNKNIPVDNKIQIKSSLDIDELMKPILKDIINHHEEFHIILLNSGNFVLGVSKIAQGGISETTVDLRIIFQTALKTNSSKIVLIHNHPSGNLVPSQQDMQLTKRIIDVGKLMGIEVLDHIIISYNGHYSFADKGVL